MNSPTPDKQMANARREEIEGRYTLWRLGELEASPVSGEFDAAHLKEIHRRIFQDLPRAGFDDVKPGDFRKSVPGGVDWMKQRGLSTVDGPFYVAYSRMDAAATTRLDKALEGAKPDELRGLKTEEFTARLAKVYAELDYVHPFGDGNSRTLRTFTKELAKESGYELDWDRFGRSDAGRDLLYIARDLSVNNLAKPHIQHENTMRKIVLTQDRLDGNRNLPDLLRDAVRPSRALAFEQMTEEKAVKAHPELGIAYKAMHGAPAYFESKMPGNTKAQEEGIQSALNHIQNRLNAGEIADFGRNREAHRPPQKQRSEPDSEHER